MEAASLHILWDNFCDHERRRRKRRCWQGRGKWGAIRQMIFMIRQQKPELAWGKSTRWMAPLNAMNARTKKKESKEGEGEKVTASINASINLPSVDTAAAPRCLSGVYRHAASSSSDLLPSCSNHHQSSSIFSPSHQS